MYSARHSRHEVRVLLIGRGSCRRQGGQLLLVFRRGLVRSLDTIWAEVRAPVGDPTKPVRGLIIDSWFDNYVGVVMLLRIVNGELKPKDKILLMATGATHLCEQIGVFTPKSVPRTQLSAGEVGFVISGIKELESAKVGDTITLAGKPAQSALPGFKEVKPQVFAGLRSEEHTSELPSLMRISY